MVVIPANLVEDLKSRVKVFLSVERVVAVSIWPVEMVLVASGWLLVAGAARVAARVAVLKPTSVSGLGMFSGCWGVKALLSKAGLVLLVT